MAGKDNTNIKSSIKDVEDLNKSFLDGFSSLPNMGNNPVHSREVDTIDRSITDIIHTELNNTKSLTTDDMSTFLVKLFNSRDDGNMQNVKGIEDIFEADDAGLVQFFQDRYSNQNLYYEDLDMICTHLYEMDEAIMTTRDSVITSDDMSEEISRTLSFDNVNADADIASHITSIKEMETRAKLPKMIKNFIVPNTLKYGKYYMYTIPYSKLLEQQYRHLKKDLHMTGRQTLREAVVSESFETVFASELKSIDKTINPSVDKIKTAMEEYYDNIEVLNDVYSIPLVEGTNVTGILDDDSFRKITDKSVKDAEMKATSYADATYGRYDKDEKFDGITGCYVKCIDPRRIIPIKILDTVLGYYYIHESELRVNKAPFSTTIRVTNTGGPAQNPADVEAAFLSKITEKIIAAFDKKFVEKNSKLKDLIVNALTYSDIYNNQLTFQFIPKEFITEFTVNEDADGEGQSVLKKSLFYAKLYLSLLVFKMVSIINNSSDTRVYYVRNSGMDSNMSNKVQDAARSLKARRINFMDLLNYNSIISRIGHNKELFVPVGRSNERGIDFDILQGQDVPLNTDLMEMLRTNMINGSGVPSVIMNYINEADYAKTLTMANSKFMSRVVSLQLDFNPQITELYRKLIKFTGTPIPDDLVQRFRYTLNPPRTLNNINNSEVVSVADQVVSAIIRGRIGEAENDDNTAILKDKMYDGLIREFLPQIDWKMVDDIYNKAKLETTIHVANKPKEE